MQPVTSPPTNSQDNSPIALAIDRSVNLVGSVKIESPFRAWHCTLNDFTGGAFSYISPNCSLHRVHMGRYCSIGNDVSILSRHPTTGLTTSPFPYQTLFAAPFNFSPDQHYDNLSDTRIGNDVWIGAGVRIKSGVTIGNGVVVGAGSVVTKDLAPYSIVGGTPARLIRMRFEASLIERIERLGWWNFNLLGLNISMEVPEIALAEIEKMLTDNTVLPYEPGYVRIWREGNQIKAKRE